MSIPNYPWYPYIINICRGTTNVSQKEREALAAALDAAAPETRELARIVYITRSKTIRGAADEFHLSYASAWRRLADFKKDIARRLGLLEE